MVMIFLMVVLFVWMNWVSSEILSLNYDFNF